MRINIITVVGLAAAGCTSASFLPQAIKTIQRKDTSGISLYMYSLFIFGNLLWFLYGLFTANIPVYTANGFTLIFQWSFLGIK